MQNSSASRSSAEDPESKSDVHAIYRSQLPLTANWWREVPTAGPFNRPLFACELPEEEEDKEGEDGRSTEINGVEKEEVFETEVFYVCT